jgi:hypothetical protein
MVPDELPVYTVAEIEKRVSAYLRQKLGPNPAIPIDVDFLVEDGEGIDLDEWPKLRTNHGIEGGIWREPGTGELRVYIAEELMSDDSKSGIARYRMTVAEELAHLQLHRGVIDSMESADDFRKLHNHPLWAEVERNAKRFAAAILIPHEALTIEAREGFAEIVEQLHQRGMDRITQGPVEKWLCTRLAKRFEVSESAMRFRMKEWPAKVSEKIASAIEDGRTYL